MSKELYDIMKFDNETIEKFNLPFDGILIKSSRNENAIKRGTEATKFILEKVVGDLDEDIFNETTIACELPEK